MTLPYGMAAELDRTDLIAVTDLIRLLVLVPREPDFFKRRRRRPCISQT